MVGAGTARRKSKVARFRANASERLARGLGAALPARMGAALRNPVFFAGSGRSGTNMLARLLAAHRDISVFPDEANDLWHPALYPWERAKLDAPPIWADGRAFTRASLAARTPADDERLRGVFGAYQWLTRGDVFVNKSILITYMLDHVLEVFPNARFIHLLRDGRAVALSFAKKDGRKIERDRERYERFGVALPFDELVLRFAEHWQDQMRELDRQRPKLAERLFEIRYEELCAEPRRELTKLAGWLGVDPSGFRSTRERIGSQNRKFARDLSPDLQRRVTTLLAPSLQEKGYEPARAGPAQDTPAN